jgi:hypothetical protein
MLVICIDCEGTVHQDEVPPGQIINQHYYLEVFQCVREEVSQKKKTLTLMVGLGWLLHRNSMLAQTA